MSWRRAARLRPGSASATRSCRVRLLQKRHASSSGPHDVPFQPPTVMQRFLPAALLRLLVDPFAMQQRFARRGRHRCCARLTSVRMWRRRGGCHAGSIVGATRSHASACACAARKRRRACKWPGACAACAAAAAAERVRACAGRGCHEAAGAGRAGDRHGQVPPPVLPDCHGALDVC